MGNGRDLACECSAQRLRSLKGALDSQTSIPGGLPDPSRSRQTTGWMGSIIDVTAQKRGEQALLSLSQEREANARQAAEEAEARRQEVVEEKRQQGVGDVVSEAFQASGLTELAVACRALPRRRQSRDPQPHLGDSTEL